MPPDWLLAARFIFLHHFATIFLALVVINAESVPENQIRGYFPALFRV
jgi:hypothetical protein